MIQDCKRRGSYRRGNREGFQSRIKQALTWLSANFGQTLASGRKAGLNTAADLFQVPESSLRRYWGVLNEEKPSTQKLGESISLFQIPTAHFSVDRSIFLPDEIQFFGEMLRQSFFAGFGFNRGSQSPNFKMRTLTHKQTTGCVTVCSQMISKILCVKFCSTWGKSIR